MVIGGGLLKPGGDISNAEILKDVEKVDLESGNACIKPPDLPEKLMWFTAQSMPVFGFVETKNKINSTKKRASRASALRADGVPVRVDF